MNGRLRLLIAIVLIFSLASFALPQSSSGPAKLAELGKKIEQLKSMPESNMTPANLAIRNRTLARLYASILPLLDQQIDILATIESAADVNDKEASHARQNLVDERAGIQKDLDNLKPALGLDRSTHSEGAGADVNAGASAQPGSRPGDSVGPNNATAQPSNNPNNATAQPSDNPAVTSTAVPAVAPVAGDCDTKGLSPIVAEEVKTLAGSIVFNNDETQITSDRFVLVFYTLANALKLQITVPVTESGGVITTKTLSVPDLEPYKYHGETLRVNKQLGATASSDSVSKIDKPGFAWLLGLALENGAVEKSVRDSVLTFSTSPAALFMLNHQGNDNPYQTAGWLNRVGVSASFNIANQDQLLGNATRSQLREYSVKFRFAGDRNPRSKELEKIWDDVVPAIQRHLVALNKASRFMNTDPVLNALVLKTDKDLQAAVKAQINAATFSAKANDQKVCEVSDTILNYLKANVATQTVSSAARTEFERVLLPDVFAAQQGLKAVRAGFMEKIDLFFKKPIGTFTYTSHREPVMGNFSEFKVLYERETPVIRPLPFSTINANAGFSFYHQPNAALKQERWRAFNAALSFEGNAASPFTETLDLSRITYSFVGHYDRVFENSRIAGRKADLASLQFLMGVPLFKGMGVPFSVTYSNATETDGRKGWRVNFGLKMDRDKLFELVRAASPH